MLAPLVLGSAAVAAAAQNGASKVLEFVVRPHSPYKRFAFWIDRHRPAPRVPDRTFSCKFTTDAVSVEYLVSLCTCVIDLICRERAGRTGKEGRDEGRVMRSFLEWANDL